MIYRIFHWKPAVLHGFIMLPVGAYYNRDIQKARKGDFFQFCENESKYRIVDICYMNLNCAVANVLCKYIYNRKMDIVMNRWLANAVIEGNGRNAIDKNRCLLIRYDHEKET